MIITMKMFDTDCQSVKQFPLETLQSATKNLFFDVNIDIN